MQLTILLSCQHCVIARVIYRDSSSTRVGCPDLFRRYPKSHMHRGTWRVHVTLIECQRACLATRNCIGVDWDRRDEVEDDRRCYHIFPESMRYGIAPKPYACCDHYRRTYCLSSAAGGDQGELEASSLLASCSRSYLWLL